MLKGDLPACSLVLLKRPCSPHCFGSQDGVNAGQGQEPLAAQAPGVTDACPEKG